MLVRELPRRKVQRLRCRATTVVERGSRAMVDERSRFLALARWRVLRRGIISSSPSGRSERPTICESVDLNRPLLDDNVIASQNRIV